LELITSGWQLDAYPSVSRYRQLKQLTKKVEAEQKADVHQLYTVNHSPLPAVGLSNLSDSMPIVVIALKKPNEL